MSSRLFQYNYTYERDLVSLDLVISIGASGAPTIVQGKGLVSIVRNSAGDYTLNLKDRANKLMSVGMVVQNATGIPSTPEIGIKANNINAANPSIEVVTSNNSGVATDPANGDILMITILARLAST